MLKLVALVCELRGGSDSEPLSLHHLVDWISLFLVDLDGISLVTSVARFKSFGLLTCQLGGSGTTTRRHALEDLQLALMVAVKDNHLQFVRMLCDYATGTSRVSASSCVDMASKALVVAATNGHLPIVDYLWHFVARRPLGEEAQESLSLQLQDALMQAACHGHLPIIRLLLGLLSSSIDGGCVSHSSMVQQVIQEAACQGHLAIVEYLSTCHGASIKCRDCVLERALENGHLAVAKWMLDGNSGNMATRFRSTKPSHGAIAESCQLSSCPQSHLWQQELCNGVLQSDGLLRQLALHAELELVQWLFKRFALVEWHGVLLVHVAEVGKLTLLRWLVESKCQLSDPPNDNLNQFGALAVQAGCARGHVALVQWLLGLGGSCQLSSSCLDAAVRHGHLEMVQYLYQTQDLASKVISPSSNALNDALLNGHAALIKWMARHQFDQVAGCWWPPVGSLTRSSSFAANLWPRAMAQAAQTGNVELLKLFDELAKPSPQRAIAAPVLVPVQPWCVETLCEAIRHCQLEVVEFVYPRVLESACKAWRNPVFDALNDATRLDPTFSSLSALDSSSREVAGGFSARWLLLRAIVQRLLTQQPSERGQSCAEGYDLTPLIKRAIQEHDLTTIHLLHACHVGGFSSKTMDEAAFHGDRRLVKFLHEQRHEGCSQDAMDHAASRGFLSVVKFLHHQRQEGCSQKAIDDACFKGHFHVVQFLHWNRLEGCSTNAMDDAASTGNLPLVQFLHQHRHEGCTSRAMDRAAANGHFQVVQFLHENREEGCTTDAMDDAARNGHHEIVVFLHEHRDEGCTSRAMDDAASQGHLNIVKFLHANRSEGCSMKAMDIASAKGFVGIVKFLHWNRHEGCSPRAIELAAQKSHAQVVRFLLLYRPELTCQMVLKVACESGQVAIVRLLMTMQTERNHQEAGMNSGYFNSNRIDGGRSSRDGAKWYCDYQEAVLTTQRSVFCWDLLAKAQIVALLEQQLGSPPVKRRRLS